MCDFDLTQALESSPESDETGFESHCFDMTNVQDEIFRLDEGLDPVVSHNPVTMRCVANLLLVVNKMKMPLTCSAKKLSDDEFCSVIMDNLVQEMIIKKTENSSMQVKKLFRRASSVQLFTLCDQSKKDIIHNSGDCKLQAITLKGGYSERKVNFKLSRYITMPSSGDDAQAVLLSIPSINLHFSCSMKGDKAVLNLEECSDEKLNSINDDGNMDRFLFYKRTTGTSVTTFESVHCRGWYISTYEDENQPVEMRHERCTNFSINYCWG